MRSTIFGLLFMLALSAAAFAQDAKRYAVLVGVEDYAHESLRSPKLKYPIEDVTEFGALLKEYGYEVVLLTDDEGAKNPDLVPNRKNIEAACQKALDGAGRSDTVLLAFAGHGVQFAGDKDAYFCPQDAKPFAEKKATLVSLEKLNGELKSSFAGVKLILVDACRNDPDPTRGRGGVDADNAPPPPKGVMALFSCAAGQKAFENDALKHGVFFHYVIEGLKSEDLREATGEMKFSRLSSFVCDNVPTKVLEITKDREQSPNLKTDVAGRSPILLPKRSGNTFKAGDVREFTDLKIKFCYCPPGKFLMGSPRDEKRRNENEDDTEGEGGSSVEVTLTKGFWLGQTEVTQQEWFEVMGTRPWRKEAGAPQEFAKEGDDYAANYVSYEDAMTYCNKLTERERSGGRLKGSERYTLPTEAQWEYACRAGTKTRFSFGDDESRLDEYAWFDGNAWNIGETHPPRVGQKKPNPWGLRDIHGSVSEWCMDSLQEKLEGGRDPHISGGTSKAFVWRGGAFDGFPMTLRSAYRGRGLPADRVGSIGLRLSRTE